MTKPTEKVEGIKNTPGGSNRREADRKAQEKYKTVKPSGNITRGFDASGSSVGQSSWNKRSK